MRIAGGELESILIPGLGLAIKTASVFRSLTPNGRFIRIGQQILLLLGRVIGVSELSSLRINGV